MSLATQSWFEGPWTVSRRIDDRATGVPGRFDGRADFVREGDELAYVEVGTLTLGARAFPAERRYRWRFDPDGRIRVLFDDGRPFHSFYAGKPVSDHLCDEDRYTVEYEFYPEAWVARWSVVGPAKDYVMETRYSRR